MVPDCIASEYILRLFPFPTFPFVYLHLVASWPFPRASKILIRYIATARMGLFNLPANHFMPRFLFFLLSFLAPNARNAQERWKWRILCRSPRGDERRTFRVRDVDGSRNRMKGESGLTGLSPSRRTRRTSAWHNREILNKWKDGASNRAISLLCGTVTSMVLAMSVISTFTYFFHISI